ncbi:winged helix-turn-helix domain-containing protein [Mesorhizobium sp.]|uniref:winged helix-turn-helix domain-containing protein n=1 Tax=Mesorhizobium sp. TaxID=1871066 RepID=UPI00121B0BE3|nr:winged helix-turn-helix domain-containing protein [Mesorhizobium sp.]TIN84342.1 MAG: winged helix-turn-helix transcriptional regulator [Mesorhizobium sp.]
MPAPDLPEGVWKSLSEIAAMRGVSKVAIKKRVDKFEADGLVQTRRQGRERLVDLAAFDKAIGVAGNAYAEQSAATVREEKSEASGPPSALRDAQTEKAQWEARRSALDVSERLGKLVPVAEVETAMVRAGEAIVRAIEQLPSFAGEIMTAAREGEPALRRKLRDIKDQLRRRAADALTLQRDAGQAEEDNGGNEFDLGAD